jgi:hypothetical protein
MLLFINSYYWSFLILLSTCGDAGCCVVAVFGIAVVLVPLDSNLFTPVDVVPAFLLSCEATIALEF